MCSLFNLKPVQAIFLEILYEYQSTLDDVQSARTITLAFILFELFFLESHKLKSMLFFRKKFFFVFFIMYGILFNDTEPFE